jgi:hypothetical protein
MRKILYALPPLLMLCMLNLTNANAQTEYSWDSYGLEFTVPAGFQEISSTGEKFEGKAERAGILLFGLYPIEDNTLMVKDMKDLAYKIAEDTEMDIDDSNDLEFNGFKGYYVEGTLNGVDTFFACMLDPEGDLNFIITVMHRDAQAAIKLIKSIHKL